MIYGECSSIGRASACGAEGCGIVPRHSPVDKLNRLRGGFLILLEYMYIKDLKDCEEIIAGDKTVLREFLHPSKADLKLRYSLAHALVKSGQSSQLHKLKTSEVYYILQGQGKMHVDKESSVVKAGQVIYIPPNSKQYIENTGDKDLKFLCIVDPAWKPEDEEIL